MMSINVMYKSNCFVSRWKSYSHSRDFLWFSICWSERQTKNGEEEKSQGQEEKQKQKPTTRKGQLTRCHIECYYNVLLSVDRIVGAAKENRSIMLRRHNFIAHIIHKVANKKEHAHKTGHIFMQMHTWKYSNSENASIRAIWRRDVPRQTFIYNSRLPETIVKWWVFYSPFLDRSIVAEL